MAKLEWTDVEGALEIADAISALPAIEAHTQDSIDRDLRRLRSLPSVDTATFEAASANLNHVLNAPKWLAFAAEPYELSSAVSDYIIVPVNIVPSDIPNRNKTAFPYEELVKFNPVAGNIAYRTWIGKPCYVEHANLDYTKSIGVILDTAMVRMPSISGDLWKVMSLCAIDRTKRPEIASAILSGQRNTYSMGANVGIYSCSVCGSLSEPGKRELACGDAHVPRKASEPYRTFERKGKKILGHRNAHNLTGFEVSTVGVPAWVSAETDKSRLLKL